MPEMLVLNTENLLRFVTKSASKLEVSSALIISVSIFKS